jgi:hypothetical protein
MTSKTNEFPQSKQPARFVVIVVLELCVDLNILKITIVVKRHTTDTEHKTIVSISRPSCLLVYECVSNNTAKFVKWEHSQTVLCLSDFISLQPSCDHSLKNMDTKSRHLLSFFI